MEGESAILCFVVHLIPGFPKDILWYPFGLPVPFWVFVVTSTLGRRPGTWVLSAQGANTAARHYAEIGPLMALVAAVALALRHYRERLLAHLRHRMT